MSLTPADSPFPPEVHERIEEQLDSGITKPRPVRSLDAQLLHLIQLDGDWNGHGEKPIDRRAISMCRSLHFSPTSEGGVQIELSDGTHDVEINISPEGKLTGVSMDQS